MLDPAEETAVADKFGVARPQVRRDHLISHLLAALSARAVDQVVFFGGTALSRTFLPDGRLSEDIDLIAVNDRRSAAEAVTDCLVRGVRREYPGLRWEPLLTTVRDTEPAVLISQDGLTVRVQLLSATGYPPWPTEQRQLVQRYSDAPPATLTVLTLPAFVAAKIMAWADRATPRDLYDLWLLTRRGSFDDAGLFARYGQTGRPPTGALFTTAPDETRWRQELSGQTRLEITAAEALNAVREAFEQASPTARS
jgi:predicted nucleotidyltransferase component of viral defense system